MQRHCAVFRTGALLEEGADRLVIAMMRDLGVADRSMMFNTDLTEALELVDRRQSYRLGRRKFARG
jgi:succinate dehydrogenase / fumarate reductase, flavoprotein subunit